MGKTCILLKNPEWSSKEEMIQEGLGDRIIAAELRIDCNLILWRNVSWKEN